MSGKWESLEKQLGVDWFASYTRPSYPDPADCLRGLISQWLRISRLKTWSHLVHALNSPDIGEAQLGDHLKQKYIPGELSDIFTVASFVYTQFRKSGNGIVVIKLTIVSYGCGSQQA